MSSSFDPRAEVRRHVSQSGVVLPDATVDELVAHLEDLHAAALDEGAGAAEARRRAMAALDESALTVLQRHAAMHPDRGQAARADLLARSAGRRSLNVWSAIRLAVRQFRQHPTFALVTVLVLGLGTGAATTVFTVVDSVVLRPLPYANPDQLVTLWDANIEQGLQHDPISPVNFMDDRALPVFQDAAAWWRPSVNLVDPGQDPVRVNTIEVSGNLFAVLGAGPQLGEGFPASGPLFAPNELICVISDRLWRTRYGANPQVIGQPLVLNGIPYIVRGVMPPKFNYPDDIDVWQRLRWDMTQHSREAHFMEAVARLAPDTTIAQAQSAIDTLTGRLALQYPQTNKGWSRRVIPLLDEQLGYYRPALIVLFGAVGLLLVIGCLNVASLLLTRALSREKEIAVRVAMGASPRQLIVQLLAESAVLSVGGAVMGAVAAAISLPLLIRLLTPVSIPRLEQAAVDGRALGLGLAVIIATTIFFGLIPALVLLRQQIATDLRSGERGSSRGARRIYSALVTGEVAFACAVLVASGLLVRTVNRMMDTPTGIDANDVVVSSVQLSGRDYADWRKTARVHGAIIDNIRRQPGVIAAGGSNFLPFEVGWRGPFGIDGEPPPARPEDAPQVQYVSISDGYFESMGASMSDGRAFTANDHMDAAGVVIVNQTFARRFLSGGPAIGRIVTSMTGAIGPLGLNLVRIRPQPAGAPPAAPGPPVHLPPTRYEVVGVVNDVRNAPFGQPVEPAIYFSTRQFTFREQFVAVRASDRATAVEAIRNALQQEAPNVPMGVARTWGERFAARTAEPRLLMTVLLFFGGLAALLAALGVYGLFSWSVALRTRELAIRLTLGAKPTTVGALVIGQSAVLVVTGLAVGLAIVRLAESALTRVVYGVSPTDTVALVTASSLLLVAAIVACVPAALRAMRVNPVEGLRAE